MKYSIEELRALEKAATPRPWERVLLLGLVAHLPRNKANQVGIMLLDTDSDYVAAARNALPDLLDLLKEARELAQVCHECDVIVGEDIDEMARAFLDKLKKEQG